MVRGCEKRIYYVKNPESEIFDEAYLILRRQEKGKCATPREIEREARRIVSSATANQPQTDKPDGKPRRVELLRAFFAGAVAAALLIGAVSLVLWLAL